MMKAIFRLFMVALLCLAFAGPASAAGILDSKHDFSSDSVMDSYAVAGETRMCVFCHTPHNAVENVPLWNRSSTTGGYLLYTSSATLTTATRNATVDSSHISYKCLTCHDGTVTIGGGVVQFRSTAMDTSVAISGNARIGKGAKGLADDHPIGFSYAQVLADDTKFNTTASVNTALKLFNAGSDTDQVECATCHDVHGQSAAGTKFLRTNNIGSNLCLTCHDK